MTPSLSKTTEPFRSQIVEITAGAASVDLPMREDYTHNFAGVIYYTDDSGEDTARVRPTAGTETFTIETSLQPGEFQSFNSNTNGADAPGQVNWSSNTKTVRVNITGLTGGATHCQLVAIGNLT